MTDFSNRITDSPEARALTEVSTLSPLEIFSNTPNPFLWLGHLLHKVLRLPIFLTVIVLSNLFFLLFVSEAHALLSRIITSDVSGATAILIVIWPTSYEMSLGSSMALVCWLVMLALRHAMEDKWLIGGVALGVLALADPVAVGLFPLLAYIFWYFQRHFPWSSRLLKGGCFLIPFALAIAWRWADYKTISGVISHSAAFSLVTFSKSTGGVGWLWSQAFAGQTITAIIFATGMAAASITNMVSIHRLIPVGLYLSLVFISSYESIASRALIAGLCLEGIAIISARPVLKMIQLMFVVLSIFEIHAVFG